MSDDSRRAADDEGFKYSIVAEQARITTKIELLTDMVKLQFDDHKTRLIKLEGAVWGYQSDRPGLGEQNRMLVKDIAKLFGIISISVLVLWKGLSPIYDAWVRRWIPQKIADQVAVQDSRPSRIVRKSGIDSQTKKL